MSAVTSLFTPMTPLIAMPALSLTGIVPAAREFFEEAEHSGKSFNFQTFKGFWAPALDAGYGQIWVAGMPVCGMVGATFMPNMFSGELTAYVNFWYVRKQFRGQGLGVALLTRVMREAKDRGCTSIILGSQLAINGAGLDTLLEDEGFVKRESLFEKVLQ